MTYLLLLAAIVAEVIGATATRVSDGFSRPLPTAVTIIGVLLAYFLLSLVLQRGMAIGVAYGIWAALGVALVAIVGWLLFGDQLTPVQLAGVVLVIAGVLALELGGKGQST